LFQEPPRKSDVRKSRPGYRRDLLDALAKASMPIIYWQEAENGIEYKKKKMIGEAD